MQPSLLVLFYWMIHTCLYATVSVVILGDSLTAGQGIAYEKLFSNQLQHLLSENKIDAKVVNASVQNSSVTAAISRTRWILRSHPAIVIVILGLDDGMKMKPIPIISQSLKQVAQTVTAAGAKLLLVKVQLPNKIAENYRREYDQLFDTLALELQIPLLPCLLQKIGEQQQLQLADNVHPNEAGHRMIAHMLFHYLEDQL